MRRLPSSRLRILLIFLILLGLSSESPAAGRLRGSGGSGNTLRKAQHVEVKVGDEFTVYRENEYVATVVIDQVESERCLGHSKPEVEKAPLKVGDKATRRF